MTRIEKPVISRRISNLYCAVLLGAGCGANIQSGRMLVNGAISPANTRASPETSRLHVIHCPALAGEGSYTLMDIPHNTTWKSKDNNLTLRARSPAPQPGFLFSASPLPASATPQCRCEF
jgi:hypothetical protein